MHANFVHQVAVCQIEKLQENVSLALKVSYEVGCSLLSFIPIKFHSQIALLLKSAQLK